MSVAPPGAPGVDIPAFLPHQMLWEKFTHEMGKDDKEEVLTVEKVSETPAKL